jgi:signal transduction histidine kinase/CheY-like chemotaxis protein
MKKSCSFTPNRFTRIIPRLFEIGKPVFSILLLLLISTFFLGAQDSGPNSDLDITEAERNFILEHPVIMVGIDPAFAPFEFLDDNGNYVGIAPEYLSLISKKTGLRFEPATDVSYVDAQKKVLARELDILPTLGWTAEREEDFLLSQRYYEYKLAFVVREDSPIKDPDDFRGQPLAVQGDTSNAEFAFSVLKAGLSLYTSEEDAILAVADGRETAMLGYLPTVLYSIRNLGLSNLNYITFDSDRNEGFHMGVRTDWPELHSILNKVFSSVTPAEKAAIQNRWILMSNDRKILDILYAIGASVAVTLMLTFIVLKLYSNRKKIAQHRQNEIALQEMVRQRTEELQNQTQLAVEASRAKSAFLSNMSHEIRTPMNAIIGMTSIAKNSSDEERKNYCLNKIEDASVHLLGVINDILDMSKIEANRLELFVAEFDFEKMLRNVINIINFRVNEKHQNFSVHIDRNIPRHFAGDDLRIAQVITNLLGNAVKFTPEEGSVSLDARLVKEETGICTIRIEVRDTGIGISEEQQARLFTSFEQAESSTSRKFGGTGLGLAISKRIVELMNGTIGIESALGKGSAFFFTIQVKTGRGARQIALNSGVDWKNVRILVVDDVPEIREYFKEILQDFGVSCDTAAGGEAAMELIERTGLYDLCFVDRKMPGMDGIELSRRIKERGADKSVIIMISVEEWIEIEEDAKNAGVDKFLPKPIFPSDIADCISECLGTDNHPAAKKSPAGVVDIFADRRILLAEDVEINREIVLALLEPALLKIDCAENGAEAVKIFTAAPDVYDMILMDVQMPEMDGYEAAEAIRAFEKERRENQQEKISPICPKGIPIIAMTANVFQEDIKKCIEAGMNDHIGKPLDIKEVMDKLRIYLSSPERSSQAG